MIFLDEDDKLSQQVIRAVQGIYARKDPAHDLEHALRVRAWGKKLAAEEGAESIVVELAALLHDIGRSGAVEKTHAESSAGLAVNILQKCGTPQTVITKVRDAIIAHSREAGHEPETLESKVLYDADKLDFVGPLGLARLFVLAGVQGWAIVGPNSCEGFYLERISHYGEHLYTPAARRYFEPLFAYMEEFWNQLRVQWLK